MGFLAYLDPQMVKSLNLAILRLAPRQSRVVRARRTGSARSDAAISSRAEPPPPWWCNRCFPSHRPLQSPEVLVPAFRKDSVALIDPVPRRRGSSGLSPARLSEPSDRCRLGCKERSLTTMMVPGATSSRRAGNGWNTCGGMRYACARFESQSGNPTGAQGV